MLVVLVCSIINFNIYRLHMKTNTIKEIIKKSIKDAYVEVIDLNNSGDHFSLLVVTNQFDALNLLNNIG